jgi:hypothetical protein
MLIDNAHISPAALLNKVVVVTGAGQGIGARRRASWRISAQQSSLQKSTRRRGVQPKKRSAPRVGAPCLFTPILRI